MNRFIVLLGLILFGFQGNAQNSIRLSGNITDSGGSALAGASVILSPENRGVQSNDRGAYFFSGLTQGKYQIKVSFLGYQTFTDSLWLDADTLFDIRMKYTPLSLEEVFIHDNYAENRKKAESLNIEVVNDEYLKRNLGGSIMESLERLPGVGMIRIGSGQSKPVIRGLGFNRVVVVENGVKHEAQQWGADHGLEIDQYAAGRLEVIKGPVSLMYGSDAIGGVIDIRQNHIPDKNTVLGKIDLTGKSNNQLMGGSVMISGRKDWLYAKVQATVLDYGDYRVPAESVDIYSFKVPLYKNRLRNTAGNEHNFHAGIGVILPHFQSRLNLSSVNTRNGFFANAHGLEPRRVDNGLYDKSDRDVLYPLQEVNHTKVTHKTFWESGAVNMTADLGVQYNLRNERSEYVSHGNMPTRLPEQLGMEPDLERGFEKYVCSGTLRLNYSFNEASDFDLGFSVEQQDNHIDGYGFIIPAFRQFSAGTFMVGKYAFSEKSMIRAGVRYDYGRINTEAYYDWFLSPIDEAGEVQDYVQRAGQLYRDFSNISWSAGYSFSPEMWMLKINLGKSFRMPVAKELAANGVNYHHFSFERGNPDLSAEISYQLDAGMEYHAKKIAVGITPFLNFFRNYIYLNPTSEHDRLYGNGNQVFNYTQSRVFRYGGEIHGHYQVMRSVQLGVIGEYVYAEQMSGEKKGFTLPFSPPASAIFNLKYQKTKWSFVSDVYISLDYNLTASQRRIVPPEEKTAGFQTVNLGIGGKIDFGSQLVEVVVQAQNLLNTQYFNHTSYYRLINLPEPGRNLVVNVTIPFS